VTRPSTAPRSPSCPSDLDLDAILAQDLAGTAGSSRARTHVTTCARCRDRLAAFGAVDPPAASAVWARLVDGAGGISDAARRRRRRWVGALATTFAAAAAALVLAWRLGDRPAEPDGERTKGAVGLTVTVKRANGDVEQVAGQGRLRAGDEMRFSLVTAAPGYAVVLGLDAAPSVSIYAPTAPALAPIRLEGAGEVTLPGSIVADATAGVERIVALVCPTATSAEELRKRAQAALDRAHGDPERVEMLASGGCSQSVVLMRKEDR
jgi:hypothetical protein